MGDVENVDGVGFIADREENVIIFGVGEVDGGGLLIEAAALGEKVERVDLFLDHVGYFFGERRIFEFLAEIVENFLDVGLSGGIDDYFIS